MAFVLWSVDGQNHAEGIQSGHVCDSGLGEVVPQYNGVWKETVMVEVGLCTFISFMDSFMQFPLQVGVFFFISLNLAYFVDGLFDHREALVMHASLLPLILIVLGLYLLWRKDSANLSSNYNLRSKSQ